MTERQSHLLLESRTEHQDKKDRAHVVALQIQGLDPLLWIPDAVLGAVNSARLGNHTYWERLRETILVAASTYESLELPP